MVLDEVVVVVRRRWSWLRKGQVDGECTGLGVVVEVLVLWWKLGV